MNAVELLINEHDKMKRMLEEGEKSTERAEKGRAELLIRIKNDLQAHERMEEEIFYPALRENPKARDTVLEGYEEHHVVDLIMSELEAVPVTDEQWSAKFKVMKENIEHHIEEEESQLLPIARRVFDRAELEALGVRMLELRELAMQVARSGSAR